MKLKNILYTGVALMSLTACNDYLDVDAPSSYTDDFVFGHKSEMERVLNGVYSKAIVNNLYGNAYLKTFNLNSDVDITISSNSAHAKNTYSRFDCDDQGSEINSFWSSAYTLIEYTNRFVDGAKHSSIYDENDTQIMQWIGEAKCLRAMAYHDLVVMFGDVPFSMQPVKYLGGEFNLPVTDRQVIQDSLIADLKSIAPYMSSTKSVSVEHCSKQFAQALIARIALTAGGYSLRPDKTNPKSYGQMTRPDDYKKYYEIARAYADSVITSGVHKLGDYQQEFVDECNYITVSNGDPIFEIPFAKESTGNIGYLQGPTYSSYEGNTVGAWGECNGGTRLNAFYRFLFKEGDLRRESTNGLWYYSYRLDENNNLADTVYIRADYSVHNNKWSKLWTEESKALGKDKTGSTGINYPYMRYADVLLMFAEADNELTDAPSARAAGYLADVHRRGFPDAAFTAPATKEEFLKAVLNERAWEFAGENSRWRDLVRNNIYGQELVYSFLRYYCAGLGALGTMPDDFETLVTKHDAEMNGNAAGYLKTLPRTMYYHVYYPATESNGLTKAFSRGATNKKSLYGNVITGYDDVAQRPIFGQRYQNLTLPSLRIYNAYAQSTKIPTTTNDIKNHGFTSATGWNPAKFYDWGNEDNGQVKDQCKYTFFGYVRGDDSGNIWIVDNGTIVELTETMVEEIATNPLPVVRYILPYPNDAIQKSNGVYKNYYGY